MKSNRKKVVILCIVAVCGGGVIAWSPPSSEDILVGTGNNNLTSPTGQLVVIGDTNSGTGKRTLVVGTNHLLSNDRSGNIVSGNSNIVDAVSSLVMGYNNNATGPSGMGNSVIMGANNSVNAAHGYAIGYNNEITGDYGTAFGFGLKATNWRSTALGRYNSPMEANDILVVGTGQSDTTPNTALRVTADGSVILGRAQGDISMGIYGDN